MAYFDSYDQVGQAEDVQDAIYRISPIDTPVVSMSRKIQATGKIHEWHEDELAAAGSNKAVEGADAPADSSSAAINKTNFCQIMTKTAAISGTLESVKKYGRDSEMAFQLEKKYGELAKDEELAVVGQPGGTRQTGAAGDGTTAREMKSFVTQLAAANVQAADGVGNVTGGAITTFADLEDCVLEGHKDAFTEGGNPRMLLVNPLQSTYIAEFANTAGRNRDIRNERTVVNVVDLYVSPFGEMDVVISRNTDDCIKGIDPEYAACAVLRPTTDWELAKVGDSERRQILREGTFAVLNSKAHFAVDSVPTDLAAA